MNKKYNFFKKYVYVAGMFISANVYASDNDTINTSRSETPSTEVSEITYIQDFINEETLEHYLVLNNFDLSLRENSIRDQVNLMVQTHIYIEATEFHGHGPRQCFCATKEETEEAWKLILKNAGFEEFKFLRS